MIPILYQENETNFNHNGIGILFDTKDYTVTEERNGPYELELVYPAGGRWAKELKDFRFISAKPNDEEDSHIFRIYETVKNLEEDTITVYAATKSNELGGNLVQDVSVTDVNAQQALNAIKAGLTQTTSYNFISDIQTTSSGKWDKQSPLSAIVGSDGSVVSKWGGELKRTNDTIYLYGRRGTNKVTTIRQGKGLIGFKMTTSIKGLVTTILPYFTYTPSDSDVPVTIKGSLVNSSLMSNYPVRYISAIDFSNHDEILPTTEGLTPEQYSTQVLNNLNTVASAYFVYMNPGCDKPKVTIEVDLAQLSDSSEYEQFRKLEHIALTDTVIVWVEKFNVDVEVMINEVTYNGMSERVTKFVAGSAKSGIIQDSEKRYTEQIDKIVEYVNTVENGIYNSIRISADSKNNIFSGYTTPDESLVKFDDIWYKPVADGDIEMYRWDGDSWVLVVVNADRIAIGTLDANRINVVNLNASNLSTGTVTGASGGWNLVTGEFWLGSSKADSKFLWDGDSLTIKVGSSNVNTQIAYDGLTIKDGDSILASFGEVGSVVPFLSANHITSPSTVGIVYNQVITVGPGKQYSTINDALNGVFSGGFRYIRGEVLFNIYGDISEIVEINSLIGGKLTLQFFPGSKLYGRIFIRNCMSEINIVSYDSSSMANMGLVRPPSGAGIGIDIVNCTHVYIRGIILAGTNAYQGIKIQRGGVLFVRDCDFSGLTDTAVLAADGSLAMMTDNKGSNVGWAGWAYPGARVYATGMIPNATNGVGTDRGLTWLSGTTPTASSYSPPAVTPKTFIQYFTSATFDTLVHGTSNVNSYYGASAAQNRWDSSVSWCDGRIRFGAEVYNFFAGGSNIQVQIRLRRKNSSHGNSGAVMPAPYNHSASFPSGATRGGWTGWATVPSSLFTSGGATLTYYNGVQGINGYAIWDAVEVWVSVTKNV